MTDPSPAERDASNLSAARAGDERAFAALLSPYRRPLLAFLCRRTADRHEAEDLLQETLVRIWRGLEAYEDRGRFGAWAFTIARRVAIDASRASARRSEAIEPGPAPPGESREDPESEVLTDELRRLLLVEVDRLPEEQREVLWLRQHGGMTFREIAETVDAPISTVLSRMHYAVTKLRKVVRSWNEA
ncbi:MAG: sigma-70 family RNA polymerase sigma factor [Gemmatimonadota bacterium]|nr:sigma-70 family RNA polymerase sigma factor [Gemmatimonadota bacterium]